MSLLNAQCPYELNNPLLILIHTTCSVFSCRIHASIHIAVLMTLFIVKFYLYASIHRKVLCVYSSYNYASIHRTILSLFMLRVYESIEHRPGYG